ncbi:MAG: DNA alkylation repair protein [Lachnospiraceae bacterium]|nr:DNA alkylation repair protein [Lachnospiraceae bacterium]
MNITESIRNQLFDFQDKEYKSFHEKLIPTVNPDDIIGIRTPCLRKYAVKVAKLSNVSTFLSDLPHKYYEENNLHGFIIEQIKDYDECIKAIDEFLPYVNNWATCDSMRPVIFKKNKDILIKKIPEWIQSDKTYTIRFGIEMLMTYFLDDEFQPNYNDMVSAVKSEEYYVNMMIAWYFATALAKQYDSTIRILTDNVLDNWTHNKTIRKAIESRRIDDDKKVYLRTLISTH